MQTENLSLETIYKNNHNKVLNFVISKMGYKDKETAEELTQDVFVKANRHLVNYDSNISSMSTWLITIASNIVIDHYRKKKLHTFSIHNEIKNQKDSKSKPLDFPANIKNPEQLMVNNEEGLRVENAINALPKGYRRLTEMFFLEECSHKEIQKELNIPLNTVKVQIMRAKKQLRDILS